MHTRPRTLILSALVVLAAFSLNACVPRYLTDEPAISGRVMDRATHRPIAGATVAMVSDRTSTTHTDPNGDFSLPAIKHWEIYWLISDGWVGCVGTLHIEAVGYHAYSERRFGLHTVASGSDHIDHVEFTLTPGA